MNDAKDILINISIEHNGDWDKIMGDVQEKKAPPILKDTSKLDTITLLDMDYPTKLRSIFKPPFVLYYKGNINLLKEDKIISTVGTREPTDEGIYALDKISSGIETAVNGGANGMDLLVIDKVRKPIVVLGCGIDNISVKSVVDKVLSKGGLVLSEYPNDIEPTNDKLKMRYRICEGIANATIFFEAKKHSSAQMRLTYALNANNEIYAVPLSICVSEKNDLENNYIISSGATPIWNSDILYEIGGN